MFVEQKRWMTAEEFNDAYAVCQFLPGPNIVNLASVFGARMRGATGALAAWAGFLGLPFVLMVTIGMLYAQFGDAAALRRILGGVAAAAAGVMISTVTRMAEPLFRGRDRPGAVRGARDHRRDRDHALAVAVGDDGDGAVVDRARVVGAAMRGQSFPVRPRESGDPV